MAEIPNPTDRREPVDAELHRWRRIYAGEEYAYGEEPGPVARRAVRYHRGFRPHGGTALDAGCGEGQDLAFLVERGYAAEGVEFTPEGAGKARRFLEARGLAGEVRPMDLREYLAAGPERRFDLVLAVNALQFMGRDCLSALDALQARVAPGGVIGLSFFARERSEARYSGTLCFLTLDELLERFREWQPLEAAKLWQWNVAANEPQPFVTLIARNVRPGRPRVFQLDP